MLNKQGIVGKDGQSTDKYDLEMLKFGSTTATVTVNKSMKTGFTDYKIYSTQTGSGGHFISMYLEPLAEYGITRHKSILSLTVKANTNYPILRLISKR